MSKDHDLMPDDLCDEAFYNADFYKGIEESCQKSARVVVPALMKMLEPRSVVDVGCGSGALVAAFMRAGVQDVLGIDEWIPNNLLKIPRERFLRHDLTTTLSLPRQFDLVMSLEVAEHLPEKAADNFVRTLTHLGSIILFSAAVPGQGGHGHINEQRPEWWEKKFAVHGFRPFKGFGNQFVGPHVAWWYSNNMMFYVKVATIDRNIATKSVGVLIDELITADIRCWHEQEKVMAGGDDAKVAAAAVAVQQANARRNALIRAIDAQLNGGVSPPNKTYG